MATNIYDFQVKTIDGATKKLSDYKGDVLLIVNVASKCGYTPQYSGLEALHKKYQGKGVRVLGFPANEFGAQEPGTDAEIKEFCSLNYDVTFDMFSKLKVKGEGIDPLFQYLTSSDANPKTAGDIRWNFSKFLVGKDGHLLARFDSKVAPDSPELADALETALRA